MDVPEAVRRNLMKHAPTGGRLPRRLVNRRSKPHNSKSHDVWSFISQSYRLKNGEMVGVKTAPVVPWPHQVQVFRRLQAGRPTRLLIADEVGLGKTIQAGLFLRQAWLEGRSRILVMVPAALTRQWQTELREKLNLDWPIYDGKSLTWQDTHAKGTGRKETPTDWTACGPVIVSSHMARKDERAQDVVGAEWDVVVLDEAHYARQQEPNNPEKSTPNKMLRLMRNVKDRTGDLILLTATPMQIHLVELYDLLSLLGMPREWDWDNFERFYGRVDDLGNNDRPFMSAMFRASVKKYGQIDTSKLGVSKIWSANALKILDGDTSRNPHSNDYDIMKKALTLCSPVTRLVSRNTRKHLRKYANAENFDLTLGTRNVQDKLFKMSADERRVYDTVDDYIKNIWNAHKETNRQAVGFVLTMYRKRLASSIVALSETLKNHLAQIDGKISQASSYIDEYDDDMDEQDLEDQIGTALDALTRDREAVCQMLDATRVLPTDTKFEKLVETISALKQMGYEQIMIFTQFTDTMDFLRENLRNKYDILCYSGRHGEIPRHDGTWGSLSREETKARFLDGSADVLLCTDAAAEGLNFQFCGAMINYDMPWNPMRVEQRIGRIDRIGQKHETIRIINMYYEGTVEAVVYGRLRERINLFEDVVGPLQPILADLDRQITDQLLGNGDIIFHSAIIDETDKTTDVDLDALAADLEGYAQPDSPVTMDDLDRVASNTDFMQEYKPKSHYVDKQYEITMGGNTIRITTDRDQFEKHGDSLEFWSPGVRHFRSKIIR